jgi:hypothetical protein
MKSLGCHLCKPYALEFIKVNGRSYCKHCGRLVSDSDELLVIEDKSRSKPPRVPNNSFERGVRRDNRGLPYLDKNGNPLRMKESFNPRDYGESPITVR